jgi:hypothetical protein
MDSITRTPRVAERCVVIVQRAPTAGKKIS